MSDDDRSLSVSGDVLELGKTSVVERGSSATGGDRRRHLPYCSVTSVRVEEQHSIVLAFVGLLLAVWGAGLVATVDELPIGWGLSLAAVGVAVLVFALFWTRQTIVIETATDEIEKRGRVREGELVTFADGVLARLPET